MCQSLPAFRSNPIVWLVVLLLLVTCVFMLGPFLYFTTTHINSLHLATDHDFPGWPSYRSGLNSASELGHVQSASSELQLMDRLTFIEKQVLQLGSERAKLRSRLGLDSPGGRVPAADKADSASSTDAKRPVKGLSAQAAPASSGLLGGRPAETGCGSCATSGFMENIDWVGGDLRSEVTSTPAKCCEVCLADAQCSRWTYDSKGGLCYLKANTNGKRTKAEVVSGEGCVSPTPVRYACYLLCFCVAVSPKTPAFKPRFCLILRQSTLSRCTAIHTHFEPAFLLQILRSHRRRRRQLQNVAKQPKVSKTPSSTHIQPTASAVSAKMNTFRCRENVETGWVLA